MFDNDFFDKWLDEEVERVQCKLKAGEGLNSDDKIVLILKGQANHFYHLDIELREEMQAQRADFKQEMQAQRADFQAGMLAQRADFQRDMQIQRADFQEGLLAQRADFQKDLQAARADFHTELTALREDMDKRFEQVDKRFEKVDDNFRDMQQELIKIYQAINSQTWKLIGAIGLIVVLTRLAGNAHLPIGN